MPSSDRLGPVAMRRIALVAPRPTLRAVLVHVAAAGVVEVETAAVTDAPVGPATRALQRLGTAGATPRLMAEVPDLDRLERAGRVDVIAGEAALEQVAAGAVTSPGAAAVAGWTPAEAVGPLAGDLAGLGAAVVPLPRPRGSPAPHPAAQPQRLAPVQRPGPDLLHRAVRRPRPDPVRRGGVRRDVRPDVR